MPKMRFPPARWVLPTTIDPPTSTCWAVPVPDDPYHMAAFRGALQNLASGYKWADDPAHTARDVALIWRDIIDGLQPCLHVPGKLCISGTFADEDYGYISAASAPCVSTWLIGTGWQNCIDPGPNEAEVSISREFGVGTLIDSYEFDFHTGAGGTYTVTVTWFLNAAIQRTDTVTFPLGGDNLIASSTPVQADAVLVTAKRGTPGDTGFINVTLWKMCYTGAWPLSGSLDIFTHVFDFTVSDGGWTVFTGAGYNNGAYSGGTGWQHTDYHNTVDGGYYRAVYIERTWSARIITSFEVEFDLTKGSYTSGALLAENFYLVSLLKQVANSAAVSGNGQIDGDSGGSSIETHALMGVISSVDAGGSYSGSATIRKITIRGIGSDPF